MNERNRTAQLRSEMKLQHPTMTNVLLQDAYKSGKKPFDFFTVKYFKNFEDKPRFLAWEAKKIEGRTFNFKDISTHQMDAHHENNQIIGSRYIISHVFCIYINQMNMIAILDPLNLKWIIDNENSSVKFTNDIDPYVGGNSIEYKGTSGRGSGRVFVIKREKVQINPELKKTIWNTKPFFDWLYGKHRS